MSYWYASLYVVVEAWGKLGFSDPVVDRLLADSPDLRTLLRRFRNAIFHYQESLVSPKIVELLKLGSVHVHWMVALHDEIVRAFRSYLDALMVTDDQRRELREDIESIFKWFPYRDAESIDSLERTLARAREMLHNNADDDSDQRRSLQQAVEEGMRALRERYPGWVQFRERLLREAGVE